MKKAIVMLTILSLFTASAVSCGAGTNPTPSQQNSTAVTTIAGGTTSANTDAANSGAVQTDTANSGAEQTNAAPTAQSGNPANAQSPAPQSENTAEANDAGQTNPVINPEFRLFGGYVATQGDDLNMRKEPNTSSEVLDKIPNGTQLDVYSCETSGWYQVIFNNKKGYVSAEFIKKIDSYGGAESAPQANEYGFYPVFNQPITSISVASLSGTWKSADDIPETLEISSGADIYNGSFTWTGSDGYTFSGTIRLEYTEDHNVQHLYYTFYDNGGALWYAFDTAGDIPFNDLYAGQSGSPHYIRCS
jgi:hypothetical protein